MKYFYLGSLLNVLWNLHTYYKQFETNVSQQITKQKAPIEKELKVWIISFEQVLILIKVKTMFNDEK